MDKISPTTRYLKYYILTFSISLPIENFRKKISLKKKHIRRKQSNYKTYLSLCLKKNTPLTYFVKFPNNLIYHLTCLSSLKGHKPRYDISGYLNRHWTPVKTQNAKLPFNNIEPEPFYNTVMENWVPMENLWCCVCMHPKQMHCLVWSYSGCKESKWPTICIPRSSLWVENIEEQTVLVN